MNQSLPRIIPFKGAGHDTAMFYATTIQLGPDGVVEVPLPDSPRPYFGFAATAHEQTTGSHLHDCYSLLMFAEGEYGIAGKTYRTGAVVLVEPRAATGECIPGRDGVLEIFIYEHGYGAIPFFKDLDDPRAVGLFESAPAMKEFALSRPRPAADPNAKVHELDRARHGRKTEAFTAYPCQIGPAGFGVAPAPTGTRPFAALVEFAPGAVVPAHSHAGWTSIALIDGDLELSGVPLAPRTSALLEPGSTLAYKIGPEGARVFRFFDTERAAIPKFENPADPHARALINALGLPA